MDAPQQEEGALLTTPPQSLASVPPAVAPQPPALAQALAAGAAAEAAAAAAEAALAKAEAELDATKCVICLDGQRSCVMLPCKHLLLCASPACAAMLGAPARCPTCRAEVADTMQLFV